MVGSAGAGRAAKLRVGFVLFNRPVKIVLAGEKGRKFEVEISC